MTKSPSKAATEKKREMVTGNTQKFSPTLEYKVAEKWKGQLEGSTEPRKGHYIGVNKVARKQMKNVMLWVGHKQQPNTEVTTAANASQAQQYKQYYEAAIV